jgi:hypothetical protein
MNSEKDLSKFTPFSKTCKKIREFREGSIRGIPRILEEGAAGVMLD